ncbi:MAG: response regulator transcription factor [Candidatus Levybacteria bacterium]|nr:response regulator transcription factor [Candidatus Levybacteria bacterium]MBI2420770.1 response regulator transcription factor [Candidatus Levybacteria bacterium]
MTKSILVVEDQLELQRYLKDFLSDNDYLVYTASDGIEALEKIKKTKPDLVLLDLGLPNMSGESVVEEVTKKYPGLRIIILSARNDTLDIVKGLNLGADDYITKPFQLNELLARIEARLRQSSKFISKKNVGDLELDQETHEVKRKGKLIDLSPTEFKLLEYLMINKNKVVTREMILNRIWSASPDIETRSVDIYIGYLRKKVDNEYKSKLIHSIRGFGYIMKESGLS